MILTNVNYQAQKGISKTLLNNPITNAGEMNKRALKALQIKSFGKQNKKNVLNVFKEYKNKEKKWIDEGKYTDEEIVEKKNNAIKRTVEGSLRFDFLDDQKDKYKDSTKMCCLSTTSSDEPDPEHALLEFVPMACHEIIDLLQRYGCNHDYYELDDDDIKKLGG